MYNLPECLARIKTGLGPFEFSHIIAETGKSRVLSGALDGSPVVVKILTIDDSYWHSRFVNEIKIYTKFLQNAPPVPVLPAIRMNEDLGIIAFTPTQVHSLSSARYPEAITTQKCAEIISGLDLISKYKYLSKDHQYDPMPYFEKAASYVKLGIFNSKDIQKLERILSLFHPILQFSHGDILLSNCLVNKFEQIVYADWEFAGYSLPDYDFALFWIIMMKTPLLRNVIFKHVENRHSLPPHAFFVNLFFLLAREIKIHRGVNMADTKFIQEGLLDDLAWVRKEIAYI